MNGWIGCLMWVKEEGGDQGVCVCVCVWMFRMGRCDMEDSLNTEEKTPSGKKKF